MSSNRRISLRNGNPVRDQIFGTIGCFYVVCIVLLVFLISITFWAIVTGWWTVWYWLLVAVGSAFLLIPALIVFEGFKDLIEGGVDFAATVTSKEMRSGKDSDGDEWAIYSIMFQLPDKWERFDLDIAENHEDNFGAVVTERLYNWVNEGDEVVVTRWRHGELIQLEKRSLAQYRSQPGSTVECPDCRAQSDETSPFCVSCGHRFKAGRGRRKALISLGFVFGNLLGFAVIGAILIPIIGSIDNEADSRKRRANSQVYLIPSEPTKVVSEAERSFRSGITLQIQNRLEDAIVAYGEALSLDPRYADAYFKRGSAYFSLGRYPRAIEDYDQAIRLDQQWVFYNSRGAAYLLLGHSPFNRGLHGRAIRDFDEAIKLNPQIGMVYYNRGTAYKGLGLNERAIKDYDEAIRLNSRDAGAYANRALAYTHLGRDTEAQQDFDRAVLLGFDRSELESGMEELKNQR